ncbi:hypothetical protein [Ruegeria sp.]|uniref:hypothetical protein n=1 Tax=Ruegeria sp. TaxID=1879320 RepID=UPI003B5A2EB8
MAYRSNDKRLIKHFAIGLLFGAWAVSPQKFSKAVLDVVAPSAAYAQEAEEVSPTKVRDRPRDVYYPNTEDLAEGLSAGGVK